MKYTSCFVGIPLPAEFIIEYQKTAKALLNKLPSLRLVDLKNPHVTVYYLDDQSQLALDTIESQVMKSVKVLEGCRISIGGMGLFGVPSPRVLYLDIEADDCLNACHQELLKNLAKYNAFDNKLGFSPHMTIAKINDGARKSFLDKQEVIQDILSGASWSFVVKEVAIYGVDSKKKPETQEKLVSIRV